MVTLAIRRLAAIEVKTGLKSAEIIVELRAAATKDAGRVTIPVAPVAEETPPSAVGGSTLVGGTEQLGVAPILSCSVFAELVFALMVLVFFAMVTGGLLYFGWIVTQTLVSLVW